MNYNDWVKTFGNRIPEHLTGIINAIDTLERDADILREFDGSGLFTGFYIRSAAKEALKKMEEQHVNDLAEAAHTIVTDRIVEEYPQVDLTRIKCPVTFRKIADYIRDLRRMRCKEFDIEIVPTATAIIGIIIADVYLYYPDLRSKFLKESMPLNLDDAEYSILYGDSYYSLEDSIVKMLTDAEGCD